LGSLDCDPNNAFWKQAEWTRDFGDIEGKKRPDPTYRTRVKMLWDDENFYILADIEEPHLWATYKEHDSVIYHENDFEVFIDPDNDSLNYYEFEMNALNTTWDLLMTKPYRDGGTFLNQWELKGIRTATRVDGTMNNSTDLDKGWRAEIVIPWSAMAPHSKGACPPQLNQQWHVNFSRVEWDLEKKDGTYSKIEGRKEHNWTWSPQGVVDMHIPDRWGWVTFVSGEKSSGGKSKPVSSSTGVNHLKKGSVR
jgi:hypothetical protein